MQRHFLARWESEIGAGTIYLEYDGEEPVRQVERYGTRWFSSREDHHPELGPGLSDRSLSETLRTNQFVEIAADEFEQAWRAAGD